MLGYDAHMAHLRTQQEVSYFGPYYWENQRHPSGCLDDNEWHEEDEHARYDGDDDADDQTVSHLCVVGSAQSAYLRSCAYQQEIHKCFAWEAATPEVLDVVAHIVMNCWEPSPGFGQMEDLRHLVALVVSEMDICLHAVYAALSYMFRLKQKFDENEIQTQNCSAQLFVVCLMMATKFLYDIPFSNAQWASTTQLDQRHLNMMELELLDALGYRMSVSEEELFGIRGHVDDYAVSMATVAAANSRAAIAHHHAHLHGDVSHAVSPLGGGAVTMVTALSGHVSPLEQPYDPVHSHLVSPIPPACSTCQSPVVVIGPNGLVMPAQCGHIPVHEPSPANQFADPAAAAVVVPHDWMPMMSSSPPHPIAHPGMAGVGEVRNGYAYYKEQSEEYHYPVSLVPNSADSLTSVQQGPHHYQSHCGGYGDAQGFSFPSSAYRLVPGDDFGSQQMDAPDSGTFADVAPGEEEEDEVAGADGFSLFHFNPLGVAGEEEPEDELGDDDYEDDDAMPRQSYAQAGYHGDQHGYHHYAHDGQYPVPQPAGEALGLTVFYGSLPNTTSGPVRYQGSHMAPRYSHGQTEPSQVFGGQRPGDEQGEGARDERSSRAPEQQRGPYCLTSHRLSVASLQHVPENTETLSANQHSAPSRPTSTVVVTGAVLTTARRGSGAQQHQQQQQQDYPRGSVSASDHVTGAQSVPAFVPVPAVASHACQYQGVSDPRYSVSNPQQPSSTANTTGAMYPSSHSLPYAVQGVHHSHHSNSGANVDSNDNTDPSISNLGAFQSMSVPAHHISGGYHHNQYGLRYHHQQEQQHPHGVNGAVLQHQALVGSLPHGEAQELGQGGYYQQQQRAPASVYMIPAPMYAPVHCLQQSAWAAHQPAPFSFFAHAAY